MITYASTTHNGHTFHICSKPEIGDTIVATDTYFFFEFSNYCHSIGDCSSCIFNRTEHCEDFSSLISNGIIHKYFPSLLETHPELLI